LLRNSSNLFKPLATLWPVLLIACAVAAGAEPPQVTLLASPKAKKLNLPDKLSGDWQAVGLEYKLQASASRSYAKDKERLRVELFEMRFPSGAYGFYTFNRAHAAKNQQQFYAGRYVIRLRGAQLTEANAAELFRELLPAPFEQRAEPPLLDHLPKAARVTASELYLTGAQALTQHKHFGFLAPAVQFETGVEAAAALYQPNQRPLAIIIFEFHTPQLAADGYASLEAALNAQPEPARKQTWLKRVGNYAVVATGAVEQVAAEQLMAEVKYEPKITWEGDKFTSIPLAYRPPDPAAVAEATQTVYILVRTFYWIGMLLLFAIFLGVIAGSCFFYWRRARRVEEVSSVLFLDE
jgi:hypothetical protein